MSYCNELRNIAMKIHKKITNFVENNKNNDDLFYVNMYLKTKSDIIINYYFNEDKINIYKGESHNLGAWIIDNETIFYNNRREYDTSLEKKVHEEPDCYGPSLEKQKKLPKEAKERIYNFYKEVYELLDELEYDQEKTYDINNFNDDFFDYYNEYMYEKELNKLKESGNKILPAVEIAADWWKEKIIKENSGKIPGQRLSLAFFEVISAPTEITDEQYSKFRDILADKIMKEIYDLKGDLVRIRCDYGPSYLLNEAGLAAGLKGAKTPTKTDMYIRAYYVAVKEGYGAKTETIYDSTKKEDIETIKKLYIGNSKVLKK